VLRHGARHHLPFGRPRGSRHHVCFQSRLGRSPWIRPYTDEVVVDLAKSGVKRALILSSAFVADCLETIEELGIRARRASAPTAAKR
jgi:protoheme ferro-lyase